jgi:hypothetical protein
MTIEDQIGELKTLNAQRHVILQDWKKKLFPLIPTEMLQAELEQRLVQSDIDIQKARRAEMLSQGLPNNLNRTATGT